MIDQSDAITYSCTSPAFSPIRTVLTVVALGHESQRQPRVLLGGTAGRPRRTGRSGRGQRGQDTNDVT